MADKVCIFVVGGPEDIRASTVDKIIEALKFTEIAPDLKLYSSMQDADELKWRHLSSYSGWQS